ncbi:MAG TPA: hypothetical protein VJ488_02195 [Dehalococcoidia bacterium]|nr:hypothetical protein [Dehalococcoidia bacterium]
MFMEKRCPFCHGQGTIPDPSGILSSRAACPICIGRGHNLVPRDAQVCSFCHAGGKVDSYEGGSNICPDCQGIGFIW